MCEFGTGLPSTKPGIQPRAEASESEEWGIPTSTEVEQRGLQEMLHLSPRVLRSDFQPRCFPKLSHFFICCSSILQTGKLRSTPMKEPAQSCTTSLWQDHFPLTLWSWFNSTRQVSSHALSLVWFPHHHHPKETKKTSVPWPDWKMEPGLTLVHGKEVEAVGVSSNLAFSYVKWG